MIRKQLGCPTELVSGPLSGAAIDGVSGGGGEYYISIGNGIMGANRHG
jgi:hypothetical protein